MFLEILTLLSQPEFPEKRRVSPKLGRSCDVTGSVKILFSLSFSREVQAEKIDSGFPKTFYGNISLYLFNVFATVAIK